MIVQLIIRAVFCPGGFGRQWGVKVRRSGESVITGRGLIAKAPCITPVNEQPGADRTKDKTVVNQITLNCYISLL